MCFFVGNDFLPNLPGQDIAENALNNVLDIYKKLLPKWSDYLTNGANINFANLEMVFRCIAEQEQSMYDILPASTRLISQLGSSEGSNNNSLDSSSESVGRKSLTASAENRKKRFHQDFKNIGIGIHKMLVYSR
jgi:5'-3' exonuclease